MGKQFQAFVLLGLISGLICSFGAPYLPDIQWLADAWPGMVLGLFLFYAGRYIAHRDTRKPLSALLVTVSVAIIGWRLAVKVGTDSGIDELYLYAVCGTVGAGCVALGLLYAWRIRSGILLFVLAVTVAGALGGFLFYLLELASGISHIRSDHLWTTLLFGTWQMVLLAGTAVGLRFADARA